MPAQLLTERRDSTLLLTISDPATRNTLSAQAISAGIESLGVAEADASLRCVVLRGDGAHFCAGGNLHGLLERRQAGVEAQTRMLELLHQFIEALHVFPKPIIACVEGAAAGAGFSLALGCDLIVAAEDARFTLSYARIGLSPDGGASWQLLQALPRARVQQMLWLAEPVTARELHGWGLVNWLCPSGQALEEAMRVAERLVAMAPNAIASAKELLQRAPEASLTRQLAAERDQFVANLFHPNAAEGLQAFFEKRPPRFR